MLMKPACWNSVTVALIASLLTSCSFVHGWQPITCADFENIPITPLSSQTISLPPKIETAGTIIVIEGSGSANISAVKPPTLAIKVEQSVPIPAYANHATVFLNGWRVRYTASQDLHVLALGTLIAKIRKGVDPRTRQPILTWNALGLLQDADGKDPFDWTYHFTVIAWNDTNIGIAVDHGVVDSNNKYCNPDGSISDNFYYNSNEDAHTALSSFFSFIQNSVFAPSRTVAMLPRGFGFSWIDGEAHHLGQVAYNLDHSEVFVSDQKKYNIRGDLKNAPVTPGMSVVGSGFVSWDSYAIYKDNSTRKDYAFGEVFSGMGGNDVGVVQPPFSILPAEDSGAYHIRSMGSDSHPPKTEDVIIDN